MKKTRTRKVKRASTASKSQRRSHKRNGVSFETQHGHVIVDGRPSEHIVLTRG